jgi:hypothetical protein
MHACHVKPAAAAAAAAAAADMYAHLAPTLVSGYNSNCLLRQQRRPTADSIGTAALLAAAAAAADHCYCICCSLLVCLAVLLQQHLQELVPVIQLLQGHKCMLSHTNIVASYSWHSLLAGQIPASMRIDMTSTMTARRAKNKRVEAAVTLLQQQTCTASCTSAPSTSAAAPTLALSSMK